MLTAPSDLLAAGFAVACFAIFMIICFGAVGERERTSNAEIARELAAYFASLSGEPERLAEWLKDLEKTLELEGVEFRFVVINKNGVPIFTFGSGNPDGCSRASFPCVWSENIFPEISTVICSVWRS